MKNGMRLKNNVKIFKNGKLVKEIHNLVTDEGKAEVAKLIGTGLGGTAFQYVAIGSDPTAASPTQTALGSEIMRAAATVTNTTTTVTNDTVHFDVIFTMSGSGSIEEAGIFNDAAAGTMLARVVTGGIAYDDGDQYRILWDVVVQ